MAAVFVIEEWGSPPVSCGREERGEDHCLYPEMLCRLEEEEEMSLLELQQRVDCVITHVGKWIHYG